MIGGYINFSFNEYLLNLYHVLEGHVIVVNNTKKTPVESAF